MAELSKRRKHYVDGVVQGTIMLRIVAHWFLFVIVTGTFVFCIEVLSSDMPDAISGLLPRHATTILVVLVLSPIFMYDLCLLTHRFAGPMVRLKRAMRDLADGREVRHIHFRDRDFCKQLATDFNRVVDRFQSLQSARGNESSTFAVECAESGR